GILDYLLVTSTKWWDGLPDDVRTQLASIIKEVTAERNDESTKVNNNNKQNIIDAGGVVRTLTPEQRQVWVEAMKPVWIMFEGDIGADVMEAALKANDG
ncbi:MAG: C4-dicarboxylate ABC transporter, partial [Sedimenticolaceae bacterium]